MGGSLCLEDNFLSHPFFSALFLHLANSFSSSESPHVYSASSELSSPDGPLPSMSVSLQRRHPMNGASRHSCPDAVPLPTESPQACDSQQTRVDVILSNSPGLAHKSLAASTQISWNAHSGAMQTLCKKYLIL